MSAMSEQEQHGRTCGRAVVVSAYGADMSALEKAAMDGAREFFGPEPRLEIVADYSAHRYDTNPPERRYHASVTVRETDETDR